MRVSVASFVASFLAVMMAVSLTAVAEEKAAISRKATPANVDMVMVAKDLRNYATKLRSIASQMTAAAKEQLPTHLDSSKKAQFETRRSELGATAAATQKLVSRIEAVAKKAERGILTRADMEDLGIAADPVVQMVDRATADSANRTISGADLNSAIREAESQQETARQKRQKAATSFQNFDQKANQQYNLLSSVMKAMNEMRMGAVRNML